jgi:hypothetical protein
LLELISIIEQNCLMIIFWSTFLDLLVKLYVFSPQNPVYQCADCTKVLVGIKEKDEEWCQREFNIPRCFVKGEVSNVIPVLCHCGLVEMDDFKSGFILLY